MRSLVRFAALLALLLAFAPRARAVEGFTVGLDLARGGWSVDEGSLVSASREAVNPFAARGFASPLTSASRNGVHLHMGWNILGHALLEFAFQTSFWEAFDSNQRGGVGLVGGRATYFPLEYLLHQPRRQYDLGVELGGGYALGGGNDGLGNAFGMDGKYLQFGLTGEWYAATWFSLSIGWRYFMPFWDRFYYDFNHSVTVPVSGFHAGWNTVNLGFNFHMTAP